MQKLKSLTIATLFFLINSSYAASFPCYIQLAKESCWQGYDVSIQLLDAPTQTPIGSPITLGKSDFNVLKPFTCTPNQQISAHAKFSPVIWQQEKNAEYHIKQFWNVPITLPPNTDKWIIKVCFAANFNSVPIPPTGSGVCKCTFPEIEQNINYKIQKVIK